MDESIKIDFTKYNVGKTYLRNGKTCLFDPIRKILVLATPEEYVRQRFVKFLIHDLEVDKEKIALEVPMTYFKKGAKGRADIIVYGETTESYDVPVLLVECKAPNIDLLENVWKQVFQYNQSLNSHCVAVTNGMETYGCAWDAEDESFLMLREIPKYPHLLKGDDFKSLDEDNTEEWKRPLFSTINSDATIKDSIELGFMSESTHRKLYPFIINLAGFFYETTEKISPIKIGNLNIVNDGHRLTSFGNAAGGSWPGYYKFFVIEDTDNNNQIISMTVSASGQYTNDPVFGNRRGSTVLIVAIDDFEKSHNSLQLNLDKYTRIYGDHATIWHDGTLTVGKSGSAKKHEVIEFVQQKNPSLVSKSGEIILGTFDTSKEIKFDQASTKEFIRNLIHYALIRDEFRKMKQMSGRS